MSIALERSRDRIEAAPIVRGISCIPVFAQPEAGNDRSPLAAVTRPPLREPDAAPALGRGEEEEEEEEASCSSSIGRNSDFSGRSPGSEGEEEDHGEPEVQSKLKGPLDTTVALEEALPIRRGMSKFYCGKSKSFASLADISSSSSVRDLAKPENAYTRKRKNLLAFSINWDRRHSSPLRSSSGSMPKRLANSTRSAASSDSSNNSREGERDAPRHLRPPLHPNNGKTSPPQRCHFSVRSFSLMDLQGATASASPSIIPSDKLHEGLH